jgi:formylmethanofuran dehydrogenase subunit E
MIAFTRTLEEDLARCGVLHSRLCPRQVIGVRMARLACQRLCIDPAIDRKQIYVFMECGRCAADAVITVTGASPTNQLMQLMEYGKLAATFVSLRTGEALRITEHPCSRESAMQMLPNLPAWEAQLNAYQTMLDACLLTWMPVILKRPLPVIPEKHTSHCSQCGDRIGEHKELWQNDQPICKPCAFGAYYQTADNLYVR